MKFVFKTFDQLTNAEVYEILKARSAVFMLEQNIRCLDMDDVDYDSHHAFFWNEGRVEAYLRVAPLNAETVKIGRVLTVNRGQGLGRRLMCDSLNAIRQNQKIQTVCVDAQKQAAGFYQKMGFYAVSDEFLEENVVHIAMERHL